MFPFTDYIDVRAFFIAFFIGMMITYVFAPPKKYIIQYPTPDTVDQKVYRDHADVCYKYQVKEVTCPSDKSKITQLNGQYAENDDKDLTVLQSLKNIFDYESKMA